MNNNSKAIIIFCSQIVISKEIYPLNIKEWSRFAERLLINKIEPYEVLSYSDDDFKNKFGYSDEIVLRLRRLISRSASISFEVERYSNIGINIVTRADTHYPHSIKKQFGKNSPPLFYYAGNINLVNLPVINYEENSIAIIDKNLFETNNNFTKELYAVSLFNKIKHQNILEAIKNNQLFLITTKSPMQPIKFDYIIQNFSVANFKLTPATPNFAPKNTHIIESNHKNPEIYNAAKSIIYSIYGESAEFREGQYEAIETTMLHKRTLLVQKTGWGKSLVYFICTKLFREKGSGVTIIVSPLLVLMENQIEAATKMGLKCDVLNSSVRDRKEEIFTNLKNNKLDLLLVTPEALLSEAFLENIKHINIGFFVIDEAHCISDWGHDFRLEYTKINRVIKQLPDSVPLLGTTATANDRVVADLMTQFGENVFISRGGLGRESLSIQVLHMPTTAERYGWILQNIEKLPGSGIIYCLTRRDCDYLSDFLIQNKVNVKSYYSRDGEDDSLNKEAELDFKYNRIKAIVSTVKLGMGYDKGDVSFVIHFQQPSNIVSYYQQIGRAGRNIPRAYTFLMYGGEDKTIQDYFINTAFPTLEEANMVINCIREASKTKPCLQEDIVTTKNRIISQINKRRSRIEKAIMFLENEGFIYKEKRNYYLSLKKFHFNDEYYDKITEVRRIEQKKMSEYVQTIECYNKFIVNCLDDKTSTNCGKCKNCLGYEEYPSTVLPEYLEKAEKYLEKLLIAIEPRKKWAATSLTKETKILYQNEVGICISKYGDPGYGTLVKNAKYSKENRFCDRLLGKSAQVLKNLVTTNNIKVITNVPSLRSTIVEDFAVRLANRLNIKYVSILRKIPAEVQKQMQNSSFQCENALKSFNIEIGDNLEMPPSIETNVLLIDDIIDSGWTLSVCGFKIQEAGYGKVFPFALADSSDNS